ncbi:hypothetical protein SNEBB_003241 [Seison nebaliae]|nr:hypothetical protein SNEBB_003241 [Seison nebaliae]
MAVPSHSAITQIRQTLQRLPTPEPIPGEVARQDVIITNDKVIELQRKQWPTKPQDEKSMNRFNSFEWNNHLQHSNAQYSYPITPKIYENQIQHHRNFAEKQFNDEKFYNEILNEKRPYDYGIVPPNFIQVEDSGWTTATYDDIAQLHSIDPKKFKPPQYFFPGRETTDNFNGRYEYDMEREVRHPQSPAQPPPPNVPSIGYNWIKNDNTTNSLCEDDSDDENVSGIRQLVDILHMNENNNNNNMLREKQFDHYGNEEQFQNFDTINTMEELRNETDNVYENDEMENENIKILDRKFAEELAPKQRPIVIIAEKKKRKGKKRKRKKKSEGIHRMEIIPSKATTPNDSIETEQICEETSKNYDETIRNDDNVNDDDDDLQTGEAFEWYQIPDNSLVIYDDEQPIAFDRKNYLQQSTTRHQPCVHRRYQNYNGSDCSSDEDDSSCSSDCCSRYSSESTYTSNSSSYTTSMSSCSSSYSEY